MNRGRSRRTAGTAEQIKKVRSARFHDSQKTNSTINKPRDLKERKMDQNREWNSPCQLVLESAPIFPKPLVQMYVLLISAGLVKTISAACLPYLAAFIFV